MAIQSKTQQKLKGRYFYESLYTKYLPKKASFSNWHGKSLSSERASWVENLFFLDEIKKALSLPVDESSVPDGFTMAFCQECWETIKEDLAAIL